MILFLEPVVKFIGISYVIFACIMLICLAIPHYEKHKILRYIMNAVNIYMSIIFICSVGITSIILVYIIAII
jgi:hypothetical protein